MSVSPISSLGPHNGPETSPNRIMVSPGPSASSSSTTVNMSRPHSSTTAGPGINTNVNNNSCQAPTSAADIVGRANLASPTTPQSFLTPTPTRVDTSGTLRGPLSPQQTFGTLSPSSTIYPSVSTSSTLKQTATSQVTLVPSKVPAQRPQGWFRRTTANIHQAYHEYWMQASMVGLAVLGLLTALAHHLYNASLDGRRVSGDTQWPPRFGSALSFFVKAILIASVEIAYKQQAWLVVKKRDLKMSTLDAIFSQNLEIDSLVCSHNSFLKVYYDPFQFANFEFLFKTWLPALLAIVSWALPLCAIASPSTLMSTAGYETTFTNCTNVPVMNLSREIGYTLAETEDDLSGLANWNIMSNGEYVYAQPSSEMTRLFELSTLSTTGPLQPSSPCPAGTNCTYVCSFFAPAYGCEERDEFGGPGQQVNRSDMAPNGPLLYASYSSLPMGTEDENGAPLIWTNMSQADPNDPEIGVFTGLPSLWLGWVTQSANATDGLWTNLTTHISECQMYNATYTFNVSWINGEMNIDNSDTQLHNLLLPNGSSKSPNATDYLEFGSYHATGWLLRNLLSGNVTLANQSDPSTEYAITWTDTTQTTLLNPASQLPAGGDDLAASVGDLYRNVFFSMMSDSGLHDRQLSTVQCAITTSVQVWKYEPFWLIMPYAVAVGVTFLTLLVGMHGFIMNGYAADANFSTFVTTSRSKDLDTLSKGSCLGHWPKEKHLMESKLKFGEVETDGSSPHVAFAFPETVKGFDKRKQYVQKAEKH
ncbi:hypothetical protein M406DRAFT_68088 [Cryphonectria parasitica EP155]|uniref:Uncharacterized protein n=1 Tax=Cryphonectria parasitica (strain ATCC 38755 / EP155) TaxID=660469 RepID=A0A9P5CNP1_CRYP1|nr:uncharacterized protein M406DRAFT_68088 [Cryphonectria parasitica EP155]KAF3765664.1 hypothetical protein M406DRAFT_68088 [Cryphonectria parasitica EP155]